MARKRNSRRTAGYDAEDSKKYQKAIPKLDTQYSTSRPRRSATTADNRSGD